GPQVMVGYWNRPDETAKVMTADGYFRTGDIGVMTPDGYTKIVDRKKDMILVSGFNVYPNEIEEVIAGHPGVLECAVIGVEDPRSGEAVKARSASDEAMQTPSFRDGPKDQISDAQLRIGESWDSGFASRPGMTAAHQTAVNGFQSAEKCSKNSPHSQGELTMTIQVGDKLPEAKFRVMTAEGPQVKTTDDIFKGKKVALFAVPGAYTGTCHKMHLPSIF